MKLPAFEDLTKEQDLIYHLDLDGNYVVSGPPGTGKSVMALYRAQVLAFDDREPALLMYSRVLHQYTEQAINAAGITSYVKTFHSWLNEFWWKHYRSATPEVAPFEPDWAEIAQRFITNPPLAPSHADFVVDEGQDLALGFYRIIRFLANGVTVFADENQQLFDHNTTLREIETAIGAREQMVLRQNHRNTAEIAAVAAQFYVGTPTGIPDPPARRGVKPSLRRYATVEEFVDFVSRYVKARSNLTIGIACPSHIAQNDLYQRLKGRRLGVLVQQYISGSRAHSVLDFDSPSLTLVHYKSLKGLEFHTLFVPELQRVVADPTSASTRMMFYVVMSRARDELHLSWSGSSDVPAIVADLNGLV